MHRTGFTITELLVSMAVIGILTAIILPAVQSVRASARLVECRSRLQQIGLGLHIVEQVEKSFPNSHDDIYHRGMGFPGDGGPSVYQFGSTLSCPADTNVSSWTGVSYLMNSGTRFSPNENGFFRQDRQRRRPRDITDGLSQTAGFSEKLVIGEHERLARIDDDRYPLWLGRWYAAADEDVFLADCRSGSGSATPLLNASNLEYTHRFTPNTRGCWNGTVSGSHFAYMPASSRHTGGVNVLFLDGHVSFVSNSVDSNVWMALGTIHGNEAVSSPF